MKKKLKNRKETLLKDKFKKFWSKLSERVVRPEGMAFPCKALLSHTRLYFADRDFFMEENAYD